MRVNHCIRTRGITLGSKSMPTLMLLKSMGILGLMPKIVGKLQLTLIMLHSALVLTTAITMHQIAGTI